MNLKEIQNLIKFVYKSGVEEVKIEREDFKITIKTKKNITKQILVEDLPSNNIIAAQPVSSGKQEIVQEPTSNAAAEELENEVESIGVFELDDIEILNGSNAYKAKITQLFTGGSLDTITKNIKNLDLDIKDIDAKYTSYQHVEDMKSLVSQIKSQTRGK